MKLLKSVGMMTMKGGVIMKQDDKIVIFDWGGVIESHKEGEYNIRVAASKFRNYFGITKESTGVEDIFDIDINGKKIGECNQLEIELA